MEAQAAPIDILWTALTRTCNNWDSDFQYNSRVTPLSVGSDRRVTAPCPLLLFRVAMPNVFVSRFCCVAFLQGVSVFDPCQSAEFVA